MRTSEKSQTTLPMTCAQTGFQIQFEGRDLATRSD
jgi:hypothetical protein